MKLKTTSLKVNPEIWKKFKIHCIKKELDMGIVLSTILERELIKSESTKKTTGWLGYDDVESAQWSKTI